MKMEMNSIGIPGYSYRIGAEATSIFENTSNVFESRLNGAYQYWLKEEDQDRERGGPITFNVKIEIIDWLDEREIDYIYDVESTSIYLKLESDIIAFKLSWG